MCDFIFEHRERQRKKHFCLLRCLSAFATPIKLYFRCVFKLLPYVALAFRLHRVFLSLRIMLFSFAPPRRYPTRGRRCTARSLCRWHLREWHSKTRGLRHLKNSSPCEGLCQSPRGPFHRLRRVWLLRAASIPVHSKSLILPDPARQPRCTFRAEAVGWVVNLSVMPL